MSNPTSNFGWQMPTPTDLVTDLPADFEVFGQAVDTSLADLKGGTTGQILSKATNADMDFTWVANDQGDITAVTAGTGITGGGTSGAVTITNDMATTITAAGDIVVGTGSGTYDNLPIGTTGQILTADTTVSPYKVKWAAASSGGMTLLSTTTLSGSTTTTATITGTYNTLLAVIYGINNASNSIVKCLPNASAGNCYGARITQPGNAIAQFANSDIFITNGTIYANDANNSCAIYFHNFQTTTPISFSVAGGYRDATSNNQTGVGSWGQVLGGAAITSLQFTNTAGTFTAGTVLLYGVK